MKNKIKRIIVMLRTKDHRYYGVRLIRCSDGKEIEFSISGNDSNILHALTFDGKEYERDYFYTYTEVRLGEISALPYGGSSPDDIRAYAKRQMAKRKP